MTVFSIPGDTTKYRYPESNADISLGVFLEYLEHIAPDEPPEVAQVRAAQGKLTAMQDDVIPWMNKAGIPSDADAEEIAQALAAYLEGPSATKKARQLLPQLLLEWTRAQGQATEAVDAMSQVWYATKMIPYMARVVAHFTGLPYARIMGKEGQPIAVKDLEFLYGKIMQALEPSDHIEYKQAYMVAGDAYELPDKHMANATVIEFAEAAQFQANAERLKNGHVLSLIDVCAVLLRKPGEAYSDEVYQRNRETFKSMTLQQALEVAFFLMRRSEQFAHGFLTSTAVAAARALPRVLAN